MNTRNDFPTEEEEVKPNESTPPVEENNEPIVPPAEGTETEKPTPQKEGNPKKQ